MSLIGNFVENTKLFKQEYVNDAAEYLFYELTKGDSFVINQKAADLYNKFNDHLQKNNLLRKFEQSLSKLENTALKYHRITSYNVCYTKLLRIFVN